jgi:hypothetical protein
LLETCYRGNRCSAYSGTLGLGDWIRGLHNKWGTLFSAGPSIAPRTSTFVRNAIQAFPLLELSSREATMVRLSFTGGGSIRELNVIPAYLPYDSDKPPPLKELREVITHCCRNNLQLIIGCDANAHHITCGSTDINPKGHHLLEYW